MAKKPKRRSKIAAEHEKPKDVSQKEWDSFAPARARARKAEGKPHPFAEAHRRLQKGGLMKRKSK